jgi:predicted nucleic acid-binding protein
LVYCYDSSAPEKQRRAVEVLDGLGEERAGAVSTQVLAEFFTTVIRKLPAPRSVSEAAEVERHLETWTVLDVTRSVAAEALRGVREHQLTYWDAQIWAVALLHNIPAVLSEDFSSGQVAERVRFVNPLPV